MASRLVQGGEPADDLTGFIPPGRVVDACRLRLLRQGISYAQDFTVGADCRRCNVCGRSAPAQGCRALKQRVCSKFHLKHRIASVKLAECGTQAESLMARRRIEAITLPASDTHARRTVRQRVRHSGVSHARRAGLAHWISTDGVPHKKWQIPLSITSSSRTGGRLASAQRNSRRAPVGYNLLNVINQLKGQQ